MKSFYKNLTEIPKRERKKDRKREKKQNYKNPA